MRRTFLIRACCLLLLIHFVGFMGCTSGVSSPESVISNETLHENPSNSSQKVESVEELEGFTEEFDFIPLFEEAIPGYTDQFKTDVEIIQDPEDKYALYFTFSIRNPKEDNPMAFVVRYNTQTKEYISSLVPEYFRYHVSAEIWDQILLVYYVAHGHINIYALDKNTLQSKNISGGDYGTCCLADTTSEQMFLQGVFDKTFFWSAFDKHLNETWSYETSLLDRKEFLHFLLDSFFWMDQFHIFYSVYSTGEAYDSNLYIKHIVFNKEGKIIFEEIVTSDILMPWEENDFPDQENSNFVYHMGQHVWITSQKEKEAWIEKYEIGANGSLVLVWRHIFQNAYIHGKKLYLIDNGQHSLFLLPFEKLIPNGTSTEFEDGRKRKKSLNQYIACIDASEESLQWTSLVSFTDATIHCNAITEPSLSPQLVLHNYPSPENTHSYEFLQLDIENGSVTSKYQISTQDTAKWYWHKGIYSIFDNSGSEIIQIDLDQKRMWSVVCPDLSQCNIQYFSVEDRLFLIAVAKESYTLFTNFATLYEIKSTKD
ncbi:MAG TPA: hypothetical protein PLV00_06995 [Caldisericia bacterium]|nr:hypothetical protein [Caldisericia bacterium]